MSVAHLLHGFNVKDSGASTTDRLIPYLERLGYATRQHDYGYKFLLGTWYSNPVIAKQVAGWVKGGDIGVGHSNGCAILSRVAEFCAPITGLIFINPALDNDWIAPPQVQWIRVFHSSNDAAVEVARFIPFVRWGDMGRVGFKGNDARYTNISIAPYTHSEFFKHVGLWSATLMPNRE